MRYRGFVHCQCFKEGKCTPSPYPHQLKFTGEEFYFSDSSKERTEPLFKMESTVATWKKKACQHPGMRMAQAVVANDLGLEGFRKYIDKNGGKRAYPKISKLLAQVGKRSFFAHETLWAEYNLLKKRAKLTSTTKLVLKEEATDRIIMIGDEDEETFFAVLENGHVFLLKDENFYILDRKATQGEELSVLFKSQSFYTFTHQKTGVDYFEEKGEKIQSIRGLGDMPRLGVRIKYRVQKEVFNNYRYWKTPIEALGTLLTASLKTHNAIVWERV